MYKTVLPVPYAHAKMETPRNTSHLPVLHPAVSTVLHVALPCKPVLPVLPVPPQVREAWETFRDVCYMVQESKTFKIAIITAIVVNALCLAITWWV